MVATVSRQSTDLNLEIDKGSTFRHQVTWKAGEEGAETAVDLTDCTAQMQIRETQDDSIILHEMTTENGGIVLGNVDPIDGTINLYISDEDSTAFTWNKAVYSIEISFSSGDTRRLLRGKVKAFNETTR